jgi:hypothetical protein
MPSDAAELASLATALSELDVRLAGITGHYQGTTRDDLLGVLFEAERQLRGTIRSIERAARLAD